MPRTIDEYVADLPAWQADLARSLRLAIRAASPSIREAIKWSQPVFEAGGPVCYFKAHTNHLTFGFWRGAALMALDERLQTSGQTMAHMKFARGDTVGSRKITALVRAAVKLNETLGNPTLAKKPDKNSRTGGGR